VSVIYWLIMVNTGRGAQFRKLVSEPAAAGQVARQVDLMWKARPVQASKQAPL
jgi:hypothetical protein